MSAPRVRRAVLLAGLAAGLTGWPLSAQLTDKIKINGYASVEFEKQLEDEGKGDPNGSFDADGVDLVLNVLPTERLRFATDLTWEHGAATEEGRGNVAVEYAFLEYFLHDAFKLRAGKMFVPFGLYNEIHTAKPLFLSVKEPFSTDKVDKLGSPVRFFPRWGAGLAALGSGRLAGGDWDYVLQVSNGENANGTENPFEKDDNTQKAVAARLRFQPDQRLSLGVSLYRDEATLLDPEGEDTGQRLEQLSWAAHGSWENEHVGLEAMYVWGKLDPPGSERLERAGFEAMLWGKLGRWRPYARYEHHDPDKDRADDQASILLGGVNVRLDDGFYLKAELDRYDSGALNGKLKGLDFTELKASLSFGF